MLARPRTFRQAFVPLDVRQALIYSSNPLLAKSCCHAIEEGDLTRKVTLMGRGAWRVIRRAYPSRKNPKAFVNVQSFRGEEIFPPALSRNDDNIVLYP